MLIDGASFRKIIKSSPWNCFDPQFVHENVGNAHIQKPGIGLIDRTLETTA